MLKKNFLKTPIKDQDWGIIRSFSDEELSEVFDYLGTLNLSNLSKEEKESTLYWLTYGLAHSMKNKNFSSAFHAASILDKLTKKYPHEVLSMLGEKLQSGDFKGQTGVFVWADKVYSATFNSIFTPTLITINSTFSALVKHDSKALSYIMSKPMESSFFIGTNALYNLFNALKNASNYELNQSTTSLIAELLAKFIYTSPDVLGAAVTKEVVRGIFSGTSPIDLIVDSLERCSKDNSDAFRTICEMLEVIAKEHPDAFVTSLNKINKSGYYKGISSFHRILKLLVSTSYNNRNAEVVNSLVVLIHTLVKNSPNSVIPALVEAVKFGEFENENGIMHLTHAFITSMDRNIDTNALLDLLLEILESHDDGLDEAFNSYALSKSNHFIQTPKLKIEKKLSEDSNTAVQQSELATILTKLNENKNKMRNQS